MMEVGEKLKIEFFLLKLLNFKATFLSINKSIFTEIK